MAGDMRINPEPSPHIEPSLRREGIEGINYITIKDLGGSSKKIAIKLENEITNNQKDKLLKITTLENETGYINLDEISKFIGFPIKIYKSNQKVEEIKDSIEKNLDLYRTKIIISLMQQINNLIESDKFDIENLFNEAMFLTLKVKDPAAKIDFILNLITNFNSLKINNKLEDNPTLSQTTYENLIYTALETAKEISDMNKRNDVLDNLWTSQIGDEFNLDIAKLSDDVGLILTLITHKRTIRNKEEAGTVEDLLDKIIPNIEEMNKIIDKYNALKDIRNSYLRLSMYYQIKDSVKADRLKRIGEHFQTKIEQLVRSYPLLREGV